jgi:hypothetical protein
MVGCGPLFFCVVEAFVVVDVILLSLVVIAVILFSRFCLTKENKIAMQKTDKQKAKHLLTFVSIGYL